jgi:hypothetical protein
VFIVDAQRKTVATDAKPYGVAIAPATIATSKARATL